MAGAALFYGDCLLTPAISVLSAIEGLNVATPAFEPLVVPIALGVLVGAVRRPAFRHRRRRPLVRADHAALVHRAVRAGRAADRRGAAGPAGASRRITRIEFALASRHRRLPRAGRRDARGDRRRGALCRHGPFRPPSPSARAWLWLVLPALLANYYGQGALLLTDAERAGEPVLPAGAGLGALSDGRRSPPPPP